MTKSELVKNLGTISKYRTESVMKALQAGDEIWMIGEFGLCFFSSFLVADRIVVTSKKNDEERFELNFSAEGSFIVRTFTDPELTRGTKGTLHIKEDQLEYLKDRKIKKIGKEYSQFTKYPIKLNLEKKINMEFTDDEPKDEAKDSKDDEVKPEEGKFEDEINEFEDLRKVILNKKVQKVVVFSLLLAELSIQRTDGWPVWDDKSLRHKLSETPLLEITRTERCLSRSVFLVQSLKP